MMCHQPYARSSGKT